MNATQATSAVGAVEERKYTAIELAKEFKLHPDTIRKMFMDEAGTIKLGRPGARGRRQRYVLRIPESVVRRVFGRITVK